MIMEGDADWDVHIKVQLQTFALGVRGLQGTTETQRASPDGDDWDILWLGHTAVSNARLTFPFIKPPMTILSLNLDISFPTGVIRFRSSGRTMPG